jgi:hypothetical protein
MHVSFVHHAVLGAVNSCSWCGSRVAAAGTVRLQAEDAGESNSRRRSTGPLQERHAENRLHLARQTIMRHCHRQAIAARLVLGRSPA